MRDKGRSPAVKRWWEDVETPVLDIEETSNWYDMYNPSIGHQSKYPNSLLADIQTKLQIHLDKEVERYRRMKKKSSSADDKWMNDVIKSGTLSDKIAALALKIQASPLHELETLDILIAMALKKEQRISQLALEALKDLWVSTLLPDRKLVPFRNQDLNDEKITLHIGLLMFYEDKLIERVGSTIDALDNGIKANVAFFKKLCMSLCVEMIIHKPEQEQRLLGMIINKLGDHVGGACSKASDLLKNLLYKHPAMKAVVVKEVRQFIHRPNLNPKALYNGIIFLNQVQLTSYDTEVAEALIETYIGLFEKAVSQNDLSSKQLGALLNGINRSYPFLKDKMVLEKHVDVLFKVVHVATFAASTQALVLISLIVLGDEIEEKRGKGNKKTKKPVTTSTSDISTESGRLVDGKDLTSRFYRALYEKLNSEQIVSRARNTAFLNLLFRSLKRDKVDIRAAAFIKRMCMCMCQASSPIAAGLLFLISEVCACKPQILRLLTDPPTESSHENVEEIDYFLMGDYDALKREPEYACRAQPSVWELCLMRTHFHPSVSAFTASLLNDPSHKITFDGDPIVEFSLASFLSRFSYKNAKANKTRALKSRVINEEAINSTDFIYTSAESVAPDKTFFHKFFGARVSLLEQGLVRNRAHKKHARGEDDEEDEEDGIDRFADKLAADLLASSGQGDDPDMDDLDNEDDDFDNGEDYGDDDFNEVDGRNLSDDEEDDNNDDDDDDDEGVVGQFDDFEIPSGMEDETDDMDEAELMAYGDDDADDVEDLPVVISTKKKGNGKKASTAIVAEKLAGLKRKKSKSGLGDFADSTEYEDIMDQIVRFHSQNNDDGASADVPREKRTSIQALKNSGGSKKPRLTGGRKPKS